MEESPTTRNALTNVPENNLFYMKVCKMLFFFLMYTSRFWCFAYLCIFPDYVNKNPILENSLSFGSL